MARPKKTGGRVTPPQNAERAPQIDLGALADRVVADAGRSLETGKPGDLETYVSLVAALTGAPYAGEVIVPGSHVLQACERSGDINGFLAASAIERFGPPALRAPAAAVTDRLASAAGADAERLASIGAATPVRALGLTEPHHNGHLLVLEAERPDGTKVAAQVTIETSLRGAAVEFAHDIDAEMVFGAAADEPSLIAEELSPADARAWFEHALAIRAEQFQINPDDDDDLASEEVLTIVRHLFEQCPAGGTVPGRVQLPTDAEIAQMIVDFRASPAAAELVAAMDAEALADLDQHIDHIVDFGRGVSGRPEWWSPITVQLFQQFADHVFPDQVEAVRPVVTAWAIWAGDTVNKDEMTIAETVLAIERLLVPADAGGAEDGLTLPDRSGPPSGSAAGSRT